MLSKASRRMFFFCSKISSASFEKDGAITISIKILLICSAVALSISLFAAIIPPKIETGSELYASSNAFEIVLLVATPQGFACFTATIVGSVNYLNKSNAPFVSLILL